MRGPDERGPALSSRSQPPRTALLVLGMHRSGTSALTRMLSLLGAALPAHVVSAERGNETGHWEPERLVNLHDEMLAEAGSRWDDWRRFEPTALGPQRLSHYRSTAAAVLTQEYGDAPLFVLKDPRLCRFVPFYKEILGGMGVVPRSILLYRNPVSVIDSLAARDDMAASYASLVWLRHVLEAEEATRGSPRLHLSYEEYLDDWRAVVERISGVLGIDWPRGVDDAGREIDAHLSRDLQHHTATQADLNADTRTGPAVRETYGALLALTADDSDAAALETLRRVKTKFDSGEPLLADAMFEEMAIRQDRERLDREHLQRVAARYQDQARAETAAKAALKDRLGAAHQELQAERTQGKERDLALAQAAGEIGRLGRERDDLQARYASVTGERSRLQRRTQALEADLAVVQDERTRAEQRASALAAEVAAHRNSTSWRITMPLRAVKQLAADPRGALDRARTRGSVLSAGAARFLSVYSRAPQDSIQAVRRDLLPGMEQIAPAEVGRVLAAFDPDFYLARYPDIAAAGADPFEHYMVSGWKEGRDPSGAFSTTYYLKHSPDVFKAGINPFLHWVLHGNREKRQALPFHKRLERLDHAPKVSAVIPNYNHAQFLEKRIDSILGQTYKNVEIVILDDCSTDGSRAIIDRYCDLHPSIIRSIYNDENSGNVFRQWRKGIDNSAGDLVWICESDDFCDTDFLATLVEHFRDRSVNIAFGRIQFADREGAVREGLDQYREGAEPGIWDAPLSRPARRWFVGGFGINNVIANVGGCIFRRQSVAEDVWREAMTYGVLGDWFLYAHLAGGGQIVYEPSSVAYFRQHGSNTSVAAFTTPPYYKEHERLMLFLRQAWGVPDATVVAFQEKVVDQYVLQRLDERLGPLESYCSTKRLLSAQRVRPHVLMAFLGFHSGGGEVVPIDLANLLHSQGHLVSMLALDMTEVNDEMLGTLDPGIPVYDAAWVQEYGADRFLVEAGISLIHSHMVSLEEFFFEKCRMRSAVPYLVTLHGSYEASELDKERLARFVDMVTHFVFMTDKNLEPFRELHLSKSLFTRLGNARPYDFRPFPKTRQDLGVAEGAVVFTLVARGIQRKGWRAAIAAFQGLRESHPERPMHLLLAGAGEEADRQRGLHGADPGITFLGYQARIHGLYRLSDVAIVPTRFSGESFPLCLIEALQTGTPAIATRIGEIASMIEAPGGAAGILIEYQRDTNAFTKSLQEAMAAMLATPERERYARAARQTGKTYSMEAVARDYAAIYDRLLRQHGALEPREPCLDP